jgi:glucose/arabinose dehydrogenase
MMVRLLSSRVRFFEAVTLSGACVLAVPFGQGCSESDAQVIGTGGSSTETLMGGEDPTPSGGATPERLEPPDSMAPPDGPEPPTSGNEGAGGAPLLEPPDDVQRGSGGSPSTMPADAGKPPVDPPMDPPPVEPAPVMPPPVQPPPVQPPAVQPPPGAPAVINCQPAQGTLPALKLTPLVSGLTEPIFVSAAPGDDTRLYVLEKAGAIRIVQNGRLLPEPFLNLSAFVDAFNEQGLVGLAFHPNYAENGRFFVQYAFLDPARQPDDPHEIVLSEFARSAESPDRADLDSERLLMLVRQPADIHLAGMLAFGPTDGMLYISRGDGGTSESQDPSSLFGKLLRIDVNEQSDGLPYGIPEGNLNDEVWSLGLRNPWRFSFDACIGDIYIGDVGESNFEEINFEPAGVVGSNYGWKTLEGPSCFGGATEPCNTTGFTPAVVLYEHDFGCSVIGGYVYRGTRIPGLRGTYIYSDYCSGNFGSLRMQAGQPTELRDITQDINPGDLSLITSFGVDNGGEMYVLTQLPGGLYRIDPE